MTAPRLGPHPEAGSAVSSRGRRPWRCLIIGVLFSVLAGASGAARAHDPFQITTDARLHPDRLDVRIVMMDGTALLLCLPPAERAPRLDPARFPALQARFEACAPELYRITAAGQTLRPRRVQAELDIEGDLVLTLAYPPVTVGPLRFDAVHLHWLSDPTFGAELTVGGEGTFLGQALLRAAQPTFECEVAPRGPGTGGARPRGPPRMPTFGEYLRLGVEHILTGYDHLLFLAGLLVVCRRLRSVLTIVTCFTVAHSITLALAALDVVSLPGRVVEPLIAATIVFVGLENLARGDEPKGRWALTFTFGLLHGFGFAGALREIGLGAHGAPLLPPLFAFNLGVELGQVAVAAVGLPLLWRLRTLPWFARRGRVAVSVAVAAMGAYWLVRRLFAI